MEEINCGDEVKCKVTGFTGIVTAKTNYIHGCTRVQVQPKVKKDGSMPDTQAFDVPQLTVLKKAKIARSHNDTGGIGDTVRQAQITKR